MRATETLSATSDQHGNLVTERARLLYGPTRKQFAYQADRTGIAQT